MFIYSFRHLDLYNYFSAFYELSLPATISLSIHQISG